MFIGPSTITQVSLLCQIGFLIIYLQTARQGRQQTPPQHTKHFVWGLFYAWMVIWAALVSSVSESLFWDQFQYLRTIFAILFYYQICRFLYALPPQESVSSQERRRFATVVSALVIVEMLFAVLRIGLYWRMGSTIFRPWWGDLPLVMLLILSINLAFRKLMAAEAAYADPLNPTNQEDGAQQPRSPMANPGPKANWLSMARALWRPHSPEGQIYRWFCIVIVSLIVLVLSFVFLKDQTVPSWWSFLLDASLVVGVTMTVFVYLRYQFVRVSLELRMVGVGLTTFLLLIQFLGWALSVTYLAKVLPGIQINEIVAPALQPNFVVLPAYRGPVQDLTDLLQILVVAQIGGSLIFALVSAVYYRHTVLDVLAEILGGFEQAERGNLAYRIPRLAWQDEFSRIAGAFNRMAESLLLSNQEVARYQENLEELVEVRTRQLGEEIEQRKNLELQQGIQAERTRIAQETHDGLIQSLAGVRIRLRRGKKLSQKSATVIESELTELADEVTNATRELRQLINDLDPDILKEGIKIAIGRIIQRQQRAYAIPIHNQLDFDENCLTSAEQLAILRMVQEAASNACKHSEATQIWVNIEQDLLSDSLTIRVRDNGRGFDPAQSTIHGWGLGNIHQRAHSLGGKAHIQSEIGVGTCVEISVPTHHRETVMQ